VDETTTGPRTLSDDDIETIAPSVGSAETERPKDADGTDTQDADGKDGDAKDGDAKDGDAKDTKDADGTDTRDQDGTDRAS
jgi:hypothetical protein